MEKQEFLPYCLDTYGTAPDYPFDKNFETAVLRHADTRKVLLTKCRKNFEIFISKAT